jgi:hypothetical protein
MLHITQAEKMRVSTVCLLLATCVATLESHAGPKPLKVFVLAGQSKEKSGKIRERMNDFKHIDGLEGEALKKAYEEYRAKHMTPAEEDILRNGVSDGGFHYLGSAKIKCGIGKGFAEAMLELEGIKE